MKEKLKAYCEKEFCRGGLKMKDFWVDFSGSMLIIHNCENEEDKEAKEIFFKILNSHNKNYENKFQYCEIDGIEERG